MAVPIPESNNKNNISEIKTSSFKNVLMSKTDKPHKVMNVAQVLQLVFLTVLIGTLLNSTALYTKLSTAPDSWHRSASMTLLSPFDQLSRISGLNEARQNLRDFLSLDRDDEIDTFTFPTVERPIEPKPVELPVITSQNKLTMWIIGDSLMVTPGESILRNFSTEHFDILGLDGQISTGMARSDVFNWFTHISNFVEERNPQLIVASFGANDDQSIYSENGFIGPFGSEQWKEEYAKRIGSTIDYLESKGTFSLWLEIAPVRDSARNDRYKIINEIIKETVNARPNSARYVETKDSFTMPDGSYQDSIPVDGNLTLLRAHDGIHYTRAGGNIISDLVYEKLTTLYSFDT